MGPQEVLTSGLNRFFTDPTVESARRSTASVFEQITADPSTLLFVLSITLSTCAFLMGVFSFFRRPTTSYDLGALEDRILVIESIVRDHANALRIHDKNITGDFAFVKRELEEIRSSLERAHHSTQPLKKTGSGS